MKVEELGLNPAFTVGGKATPWYDQPWAPFATAMVRKTDAAGNGWLSPLIHLGHPGLYTIVMQADGVRSWPMYVPVLSKLSSMEISTQPSMQDASMTTLGLVVGESLTGGGGWHWPVGQELAVPMKVTLKDASGNALELYQPMVVPVHPDTGAPLDHLVSLDLPTIGLAQTDRGIGSTGFKRGTPADSSGVSLFPLKLIDGVHGTCFALKAWFKAFSPADVAILVGEGVSLNADGTTSFDDIEVAATSTVRFCVKNEVAVAVASQPPTAMAVGVGTDAASVRISIPMVPHKDTNQLGSGQTFYRFSRASMVMAPQLLPKVFGNKPVSGEKLRQLGQRMLSANRCLVYGGFTVTGTCKGLGNDPAITAVNVADPEFYGGYVNGGQVVGGTLANLSDIAHLGASGLGLMPLYLPTIEGKAPTFTARISMAGLTVKYLPPGGSSLQLGAGTALTMGSGSSARSSEVSISSTPSAVTLLTVPPRAVKVNEPFLVKALVTISSGAPLAGANVLMSAVPTSGPSETPLNFLSGAVGQQTVPMGELAPPKLLNSSVEAVTDAAGIARFILTFDSGPPVSRASLLAKAGRVSSPRSDPVVISNDVTSVNATNVTLERKGAQGIGSTNTQAVRMKGEQPESFPIVLDLPGEMALSVQLRPTGVPADGNVSYLRRMIGFNVFSQADLDKLAEQQRKIDEQVAKLANCSDIACAQENAMGAASLGATMGRRLQSIDVGALSNVQGVASSDAAFSVQSALADSAEVEGVLASTGAASAAFEQAQQLADTAMLESLVPTDLSALALPTPDKFTQFAGLPSHGRHAALSRPAARGGEQRRGGATCERFDGGDHLPRRLLQRREPHAAEPPDPCQEARPLLPAARARWHHRRAWQRHPRREVQPEKRGGYRHRVRSAHRLRRARRPPWPRQLRVALTQIHGPVLCPCHCRPDGVHVFPVRCFVHNWHNASAVSYHA